MSGLYICDTLENLKIKPCKGVFKKSGHELLSRYTSM